MRKNGDNWVKLMVFLEVSVFSGIHNIAGENLSRFMDLDSY